jgi:ligand-binding sensor domain-containing protein
MNPVVPAAIRSHTVWLQSRRPLLLRFCRRRATLAATLVSCLACVLFLAAPVHALDPDKRITQYIHTSWKTQDGSVPAMFSIAQTSDGFLWFLSPIGDIYRHDGVRFVPWSLPDDSTQKTLKLFGDRADGLWLFGDRGIARLKGRVVISHFELKGFLPFGGVSEDADGSLWAVRGRNAVLDAPLCRIKDHAVKCFGKADGIPISPADALLSDGKGGFWIGGQTALLHWRDGVSQVYPIPALKSNAGNNGISSLARGPDGTLWVGILSEGAGLGLGQIKDGVFRPFVTPTFDGSVVPSRRARD